MYIMEIGIFKMTILNRSVKTLEDRISKKDYALFLKKTVVKTNIKFYAMIKSNFLRERRMSERKQNILICEYTTTKDI